MAVKIDKAGLPKRCVTHGLRKAAARRLAEAGCTANEIASITGHATLQEVSRYTKAAEQRTLAQSAMRRLSPQKPKQDSQTGLKSLGFLPKNPSISKSLEEGWWWRQSRARRSQGPKWAQNRKNREFSRNPAQLAGDWRHITAQYQWLARKISARRNREFESAEQGLLPADQGAMSAVSGAALSVGKSRCRIAWIGSRSRGSAQLASVRPCKVQIAFGTTPSRGNQEAMLTLCSRPPGESHERIYPAPVMSSAR
jgi:hypothetical protein